MGGIGSVFAVIFGILWTIFAVGLTSDAPRGIGIIFPLFGVCFVLYGIAMAVYNFKNATQPDRFSSFDIVDGDEEPDPLNEQFGRESRSQGASVPGREIEGSFCPYCRAELRSDFEFCPKCGANI